MLVKAPSRHTGLVRPRLPHPRRLFARSSALALVLWGASAAHAQGVVPAAQNVVNLTAGATVEMQKDWIGVVFSTTKEGADAAAVQSQLRQALDAALTEARKVAKPGQIEVQTGGFSLHPRYTHKPNAAPIISGWQGSTELVVEGRDVQGISQLTGRISSLSIARVGFSLSREAREKVEADVAAQAIARFRATADAVSKQFGFTGYTVREVAVNTELPQPKQATMMRAQAMRASADESLPVEAGKGTVTAVVSGSVQMR